MIFYSFGRKISKNVKKKQLKMFVVRYFGIRIHYSKCQLSYTFFINTYSWAKRTSFATPENYL